MRVLRLRMLAVKNSMKWRLARSPRAWIMDCADQRRRRHDLVGQQDRLPERAARGTDGLG
jgi:hypothetical protein